MPDSKYGNNVITLDFNNKGPDLYRQVTRFSGKSFGLDFHVEYGTYWAAGKMGADPNRAHVHEYDQTLVFMGTDTDKIGELGAEVELCLGPQCEKHVFTTSTAVTVPKGMPHFPVSINRLDRRFIYMEVSSTTECKETPIEVTDEMRASAPVLTWTSPYDDNIISMSFVRKGAWHYGPRNRDDSGGYLTFITSKVPGYECTITVSSRYPTSRI